MGFAKKRRIRSIFIVFVTLFALVSLSIWLLRITILRGIGDFLIIKNRPKKSDVIVVLRGDLNFSRTLESARLFHEGYAEKIFISTSLLDSNCSKLEKLGASVHCGQEMLKDILIQLGVDKQKILLGDRKPGGGTKGESRRVKQMMLERNYKKALIVTSWYHTRRAEAIYEDSLSDTNLEVVVICARDDTSSPSNWWEYRYVAIAVLEEFPKLLIYYLLPSSDLQFKDDSSK